MEVICIGLNRKLILGLIILCIISLTSVSAAEINVNDTSDSLNSVEVQKLSVDNSSLLSDVGEEVPDEPDLVFNDTIYITSQNFDDYFDNNVLKSRCSGKTLIFSQDFENLGQTNPDDSVVSGSVGKIVLSSTWYIAVALDKRTAETFRDGATYPITFQYSNNTELKMKLDRRITRTDKDITVLVFSTKQMPEGFDYSRKQTIELPTATHEGIRVSKSAIRMKDGVTGVYAVVGSKIVFKKTDVLYNYGSYCICAIPKNPAYPDRYDVAYSSKTELSLHDSVVIDGEDIYDGMRLK